ncbi:MAG: hypothetical protein ANABAC_0576 [Anaerolineae bacterium]|nr:MAG: hypothetical protein ANABAC_0576 [Anaerolineae bacterium]
MHALNQQTVPHRLSGSPWAILRRLLSALGDILYGATIYEMVHDLEKERASRENLFVLIVFGDLFGIPILPPYYTLRLIPYFLPRMPALQRSILRERDLTDLCDQDFT